jgi:ArsR family transcriptional regulator
VTQRTRDPADERGPAAGLDPGGETGELVLADMALAILLDEAHELRGCDGHRSGLPLALISKNIDIAQVALQIDKCQYALVMKRITDPDALLLQGAADPTRLAILRELAGASEVCACDFTACCTVAQPTVSHHLKVLREAGWVSSERRGSWVFYRIRPEAVERFQSIAGALAPPIGEPAGHALPVLQPTG